MLAPLFSVIAAAVCSTAAGCSIATAAQAAGRGRVGKVHWRNMREQLELVGPRSLGVALLTASFVGMVFTIQVPPQPPALSPSQAALLR